MKKIMKIEGSVSWEEDKFACDLFLYFRPKQEGEQVIGYVGRAPRLIDAINRAWIALSNGAEKQFTDEYGERGMVSFKWPSIPLVLQDLKDDHAQQ